MLLYCVSNVKICTLWFELIDNGSLLFLFGSGCLCCSDLCYFPILILFRCCADVIAAERIGCEWRAKTLGAHKGRASVRQYVTCYERAIVLQQCTCSSNSSTLFCPAALFFSLCPYFVLPTHSTRTKRWRTTTKKMIGGVRSWLQAEAAGAGADVDNGDDHHKYDCCPARGQQRSVRQRRPMASIVYYRSAISTITVVGTRLSIVANAMTLPISLPRSR